MTTYALIGAAGFVAPRHMKAIKETGGELVAATDPHDSVGILDSYFPNCEFFTEFERFGRYINKIGGVDYVVVCSPNYLHDFHCISAMRAGCNVICEKPLVLTERNLDAVMEVERITGKRVNVILQLRLHPEVQEFEPTTGDKVWIHYATPRGQWFRHSWKGEVSKSGGLPTNIGVHFFDLVAQWYGKMTAVTISGPDNKDWVYGIVCLERATVEWILSVERDLQPCRSFTINGGDKKLELSNGFADLHTKSYQEILAGRGFGTETARESIRICEKIRGYTPLCS